MKKGMVSAILVVVLLWISQAMSMGTDGMFASPWPGQNGVNPFGKEDPEGVPPKVAETTLTSFLSSRAVKAGQELTIQYDLLLASADQNRIEIIEKGTTLSYLLLRVTNEESEETEVVSSGKVSFSMDRSENERCELILRPETTEN